MPFFNFKAKSSGTQKGGEKDKEAKHAPAKVTLVEQFHHPLAQKDILKAVKILRGISNADNNCLTLAKDLLEYLRTGIMPQDFSEERSIMTEDLPFRYQKEYATPNNTFKQINHIEYVLSGENAEDSDSDAESGKTIFVNETETRSYFDLVGSANIPERYTYYEVSQKLKEKAQQNNTVYFGLVFLGFVIPVKKRDQSEYDGHFIVYYATPEAVYFIDAQKIVNGEYSTQKKDQPIFKNLEDAFDFLTPEVDASSDEIYYGKYCFVSTTDEFALKAKSSPSHAYIDHELSSDGAKASHSSSSDNQEMQDEVKESSSSFSETIEAIQATLKPAKVMRICMLCELTTLGGDQDFCQQACEFLQKNPKYANAISDETDENLLMLLAPAKENENLVNQKHFQHLLFLIQSNMHPEIAKLTDKTSTHSRLMLS